MIVLGVPPSDVPAAAVIHALWLPLSQYRKALAALAPARESVLLCCPKVLDSDTCAALRTSVDASAASNADSVDGLPDHQLDLSLAQLEGLIGKKVPCVAIERGGITSRGASAAEQLLSPSPQLFAFMKAFTQRALS